VPKDEYFIYELEMEITPQCIKAARHKNKAKHYKIFY
jgi:hypothetical protein